MNILLKTGLLTILLIIIGKLISFAKDIAISTYFGASTDTDAFFIAFNITSVLFVAFSSTVSLVFLPLYSEYKHKYNTYITNKFSSNIINIYLFFALLIMAATIWLAPFIIDLLNSSTDIYNIELSTTLLRIMSFSLFFTIFINFMTSIELSNEQYLYPHLSPIINNSIVVISIVLLANTYGIIVPAIAGVIAWVIQVPIHKWFTRKYFEYKIYINLKDTGLKKMGLLFFPAFLGVFVDQMNIMVDTILASGLSEGSVSALNYSNRLISFASGIFIMAIMSITYPLLSKYVVKKESEKLSDFIRVSIRLLLLIMLPITAIIFVYNHEIVSIVFQRGKFDVQDVQVTASVFFYYGAGILFLALRELFNKVFYAQKDTKTPLFISTIAVSTNIILSIIFVRHMGVEGLALASSISLVVYVVLQLYVLNKHLGDGFYQGLVPFISKLFIAVSISSYMMWIYKKQSYFHHLYLDFIAGVLLGVISLLLLLLIFKNEEISNILLKKRHR